MDEGEWLNSADPQAMLDFLRTSGKLSERKARLFGAACCRRIWHLLSDERSRRAVELAERFADGWTDENERGNAEMAANEAARASGSGTPWFAALAAKMTVAHRLPLLHIVRYTPVDAVNRPDVMRTRKYEQAHILRDLFGNLFRPTPPLAASVLQWHDGTVKRLAEEAYQERLLPSGHLDPHRLAVLADALLDAGCTDPDILGHLRGPGLHYRGCHVVDLLLGKS